MILTCPEPIDEIREASRALVREFGFLDKTLAGTDLSPSAVHAVIELGLSGELTAKELSSRLMLEKSTVSRLLRSLEDRGEVAATRLEEDARSYGLHLTDKGRVTFEAVTLFGKEMVIDALPHLATGSPENLAATLHDYANALHTARTGARPPLRSLGFEILEGYQTGMIGDVSALHARTHGPIVGNGPAFESVVSKAMAEFMTRIDHQLNNSWNVVEDRQVIASITIDGQDLGNNIAHLRWFILSERLRGKGLGKRLLAKALAHCEKHGFDEIHLWTLRGLEPARALYERNGFSLVDEYEGDQWGRSVIEQKFVKKS
ncbi:bifunctional helix-turn-helix transcriptional regulator/GNAT family N-acetyltransferase [Labrenzia sp. CE80]|uniref:bifunctional helix-turn-helix transcriptional regulator/GNAT family N-acetyltransferase n=1 Tax=Labrenzia sp. CE80 TaxID=1788986 RepID=UPI00129A8EB7|nr:bifunctional helix-turn-helix transcriptional regulator/GNAT family N-acetyltransferase [Labrenzia sp. CE80]